MSGELTGLELGVVGYRKLSTLYAQLRVSRQPRRWWTYMPRDRFMARVRVGSL